MGLKFPTAGNLRWLEKLAAREYKDENTRKTLRYYRNLFRATPAWLTAEMKCEMRRIYSAAHARGLVVDHIVPLSSPLVCGLHVPWNLQACTQAENDRKANLRWPGCPFEQPGFEFDPQIEMRI